MGELVNPAPSQEVQNETEVQCELGSVKLYCKGADSAILKRLRDPDSSMVDATVQHIEEFSRNGYRTFCIAEREVWIKSVVAHMEFSFFYL